MDYWEKVALKKVEKETSKGSSLIKFFWNLSKVIRIVLSIMK